uniref:Lactadherin n=1 Tax=Phallusia mammillata TaxID=59560 RepID=A0A6F9DLJ3_9ASCI|nr:lactadherin [Phallusia mammillata]
MNSCLIFVLLFSCAASLSSAKVIDLGSPLSFVQAYKKCESLGASLATYGDLLEASRNGFSHCVCGWNADVVARYPMNHTIGDCGGGPGVHYCDWNGPRGAFCYIPKIRKCGKPLGMETGKISHRSVTSSSVAHWLSFYWNAHLARLNRGGMFNGWIPHYDDVNQYIQIDLGEPTAITGVLTQGVSRWTRHQCITKFRVAFSKDGQQWSFYADGPTPKIFNGNNDKDTVVRNMFETPILARYFRLLPYEWLRHPALRMELIGCSYDEYDAAMNHRLDTEIILNN